MCWSKPCYQKSKEEKQFCRRIFDNDGRSVFDHLSSELAIPFVLPLILVGFLVLFVTSALVSYVIHNFTDEIKSNSERNNLFGDLFSSTLFLLMICLLNIDNFAPKSFCLMNPMERMCECNDEDPDWDAYIVPIFNKMFWTTAIKIITISTSQATCSI